MVPDVQRGKVSQSGGGFQRSIVEGLESLPRMRFGSLST